VILLPVLSDILSGHTLFSQQSYQSTLSSHSNFPASHKTPCFHRNQTHHYLHGLSIVPILNKAIFLQSNILKSSLMLLPAYVQAIQTKVCLQKFYMHFYMSHLSHPSCFDFSNNF